MTFIRIYTFTTLIVLLLLGSTVATAATSTSTQTYDTVVSDTIRSVSAKRPEQPIPTEDGWWHRLNDPLLDSLIELAVRNNYDVLMAVHRIKVARLQLQSTRSAYWPQLTMSGGWSRSRTSGAMTSPVTQAMTESGMQIGVDMSWQIDLFGRIRQASKARKASWQASRADYAATMVTLCADVATAYVNLRVSQAELAVAEAHLATQQHVVEITRARHEAGLNSRLDVEQAVTVSASTRATLPQLRQQANAAICNLALLLAITPAEAQQMLDTPRPLPTAIHLVPASIPMELLRRRPDVVEAERNLEALAAQVGVAKKEFLPALSLDASIGTQAHRANDMFTSQSFTYSIAPTISWTIFDGLARNYAVAEAREQVEIGVQTYNMTLLQALTETDRALYAYHQTLQSIDALTEAAQASERALKLALDLYKQGLDPFTNVANAQIDFLTYTNSAITAHGNALLALIELYQALGGGWQVEF